MGKRKTLEEINYYRCIGENKRFFSNELFILSALQRKDIEPIRLWRNKKIELLRQNKVLSKEEQKLMFKSGKVKFTAQKSNSIKPKLYKM